MMIDEKLIKDLTWEWYNGIEKEEHKELYQLFALDIATYFQAHLNEFGGYRPM